MAFALHYSDVSAHSILFKDEWIEKKFRAYSLGLVRNSKTGKKADPPT
jgi:hypothetical protein